MRRLAVTVLVMMCPMLFEVQSANAQVVTGPSNAVFDHPDADFNVTASYTINYYQCTSVNTSTGAGVGCGSAPFSSGSVPKANVTTTTSPTRSINLKAAPANGPINAMPAGVPFISKILAVGDPNAGG